MVDGQEPERGPATAALADLVRGQLGSVASIVEVTGPDLDLGLRLDLEHSALEHSSLEHGEDGSIGYSRADPAAWLSPASPDAPELGAPQSSGPGAEGPRLGPDTLAVIPVGPDPARQLPLEAFGRIAGDLPDGARALLLLGFAPPSCLTSRSSACWPTATA